MIGRIEVNRDHLNQWELFKVAVIDGGEQKMENDDNAVLEDGEYMFVASHSDKVLDVAEGSMCAGAKLTQWNAHKGANQQFVVKRQQCGYYAIQCKHSGLYWDIESGSNDNFAKLIQWQYHGGDNQLFEFVHRGKDQWAIKAKHSGRVLDIEAGHEHAGAKVMQYDAHYGANQLFYCKKM